MALPGMPVPVMLVLLAVKGTIDPIFAGVRAASLPELLGDEGFPLGRSLLRLVSQNAQFALRCAPGVGAVSFWVLFTLYDDDEGREFHRPPRPTTPPVRAR